MNSILYLSRADVESVGLDMPAILKLIERAFREKAAGRVEMPPKPGIHTLPDAFLHAMPAYIPALRSAGIKWIGGYPENAKRGLPYISGLLVLNDVETGLPYAVMDCTWITAYRTGAASALAASVLACPESKVAAILACGAQGRTNLEALAAVFPLTTVYVYDIRPEAQERYIAEMSAKLGLEMIGVDDPHKAVSAGDLVVTSGPILKHPTPTIQKDWLKPGAFASAVDFDSYWAPEALAQIDKLCTDDLPQFHYYREIGYFQQAPMPYAELGEVLTGTKPRRERPDERTMAMNLGLAMEDLALAPTVYRLAKEKGIGISLPM